MKRQPTEEQKAKAAERRERFRALVKTVAAMSDEEKAHLTNRIGAVLTVEGRALSLHNTCLLLKQCPTVSVVGGFRQWLKAGRAVRKGEHGHMLWFPIGAGKSNGNGHAESAPAEPSSMDTEDDTRFLIGTVFDVSHTDEVQTAATA